MHQHRVTLLVGFLLLLLQARATISTESSVQPQGNHIEDLNSIKTKFSLRRAWKPNEDSCYIIPGQESSLSKCNFNSTSKTILIVHGWSVSGLFESWIEKLVTALYHQEPDANVLVVDWLNRAHQHYPIAAQNTMLVGQDISKLIDWLETVKQIPLDKVHLIGYSLGAHVAGFAGSHTANKIGRITGLDPAGPVFEGTHAHGRLSPDDATFVDVLHTFTRESLGISIGIRQPVGHVDIYPNGGSFQPGCDLQKAVNNIVTFGIFAFSEAVKCEHQRSIHLFIDSLLYKEQPCQAYRCHNLKSFKKGMCLNCRKNRCNTLGYNVKRVSSKRSTKMFLKTRANMPFRVYHYQLKIHFSSKVNDFDIDPTLSVSLHGTKNDVKDLPIEIVEMFAPNKTHSFLVVTEVDVGDLLLMRFKWETALTWGSLWKRMRSSIAFYKLALWAPSVISNFDIHVERIRVKSGESQKRVTFCLKDPSSAGIPPSQEVTLVKCTDRLKAGSTGRPNGDNH